MSLRPTMVGLVYTAASNGNPAFLKMLIKAVANVSNVTITANRLILRKTENPSQLVMLLEETRGWPLHE